MDHYWHWNVHRSSADNLEHILNDHADKGYELHHVRSVGAHGREHLLVVFRRPFTSPIELAEYRDGRARAKTGPVKRAEGK